MPFPVFPKNFNILNLCYCFTAYEWLKMAIILPFKIVRFFFPDFSRFSPDFFFFETALLHRAIKSLFP